jgi:hypothetical protein
MYYKNNTIIIRNSPLRNSDLFLDLFTNENVTRYLPYKSPEEFKQMFEKALSDYKKDRLADGESLMPGIMISLEWGWPGFSSIIRNR